MQEYMELPTESLDNLCDSLPDDISQEQETTNVHVLSPVAKHWEAMRAIYHLSSCRSRNLQLGVTSIMRSVTEARVIARLQHGPALRSRLHSLESDCSAVMFALPSWIFNPAQHTTTGETMEEHRSRLGTLFVFFK